MRTSYGWHPEHSDSTYALYARVPEATGPGQRYVYFHNDHLDVSPDVITVKPLPQLTLDYFLQQDVIGDDPLTPEVEAVEPFTLGVRVKNNGLAVARNLKIDSAQPRIIDNQQGLCSLVTAMYIEDVYVNTTERLPWHFRSPIRWWLAKSSASPRPLG